MKWTIQLAFEDIPGCPAEHELGIIDRKEEISLATVGLTLAGNKAPVEELYLRLQDDALQRETGVAKGRG
jgi:hypothetical protein